MIDRYGPPDQPMVFRGFVPPSSDFDRVRTGIDQRLKQFAVTFTTNSGVLDIPIAGNFLLIDSFGTLEVPRLTTVEINPDSDVPGGELTIGRGAIIRLPFTALRFRWTGGQLGRGFRIIYGTDVSVEAPGLYDIQNILGTVTMQPATFLSNTGTMRSLDVSDYAYDAGTDAIDQSTTALAASSVTAVMTAAATDAWLHHAQALSVGTGLTQLALVAGASAPTSFAALNGGQIVAQSYPTAVNGTTVYSRLALDRSVRLRSGVGLWWLMGATAETLGARTVRTRSL